MSGTIKKCEILFLMFKSEKLVLYLTEAYNTVLNEGTVHVGWKGSKTVMIPKTEKPIAKEQRVIALTNMGYKIFIGLVVLVVVALVVVLGFV